MDSVCFCPAVMEHFAVCIKSVNIVVDFPDRVCISGAGLLVEIIPFAVHLPPADIQCSAPVPEVVQLAVVLYPDIVFHDSVFIKRINISFDGFHTIRMCPAGFPVKVIPGTVQHFPAGIQCAAPVPEIIPVSVRIGLPGIMNHSSAPIKGIQIDIDGFHHVSFRRTCFLVKVVPVTVKFLPAGIQCASPAAEIVAVSVPIRLPGIMNHSSVPVESIQINIDRFHYISFRRTGLLIEVVPVAVEFVPAGVQRAAPVTEIIQISSCIHMPAVVQHRSPAPEIVQIAVDDDQFIRFHASVLVQNKPVDPVLYPTVLQHFSILIVIPLVSFLLPFSVPDDLFHGIRFRRNACRIHCCRQHKRACQNSHACQDFLSPVFLHIPHLLCTGNRQRSLTIPMIRFFASCIFVFIFLLL